MTLEHMGSDQVSIPVNDDCPSGPQEALANMLAHGTPLNKPIVTVHNYKFEGGIEEGYHVFVYKGVIDVELKPN